MLGIPCPFILGGDDAVIPGGDDRSGERCAIQFLDVNHLLQRNLLTFLGTQLFDKRQFGKKEETGKEITTLLQPQRTIFREEEKQMSQFMYCREAKFLYATLFRIEIENHQRMLLICPGAHSEDIIRESCSKYHDAFSFQESQDAGDRSITAMPLFTKKVGSMDGIFKG